ncbi:DUF6191 domain-containing protein [Cellulomonas rhizosphaerae]|uniref:Uncharacterized protein n=1 Tax=Cellulomonas rhizosphaerae TaxID=2293719 RepID=A0A413RHD5_9CELL|nr:DUF6191 domain-containing protein [Cellulomonas rhizosphaerae]RHA37532.1 hypothetical protein D1825_16820 [Cellulomonas rhizosphaerae]
MRWVLVVAAVVLVALLVDRLVARGVFDRRRERPRSTGGASSSGMLGDFIEVFQPNRVHLTAEQERQQLDIDYAGDDAPPFDIDSGTVTLRPSTPKEH